MKIAPKFTLALIAGIVAVHTGSAAIRVQREVRLFQHDTSRDTKMLGRTLAYSAENAWRAGGEAEVARLIAHATRREHHVSIRWIWLDAPPGHEQAPTVAIELLEPLTRGRSTITRASKDDPAFYTYLPVNIPGDRIAAIEVKDPFDDAQSYMRQSIINISLATLALVALCALLAWGLGAALIGRRVRLLVEQARRVGKGDLAQRLMIASRDEIGELAREMNKMCEGLQHAHERAEAATRARIATMEQLRHADRLTTVGTLASGVAHELGTPINVVEGYAQLLREDPAISEQARESVDVISRQCKRMTQIIRQLLDFARRGGIRGALADLRQVASETLRMIEPLARKRDVKIILEQSADAAVARIEHGPMQQVLANLMINGLHAMPNGGTLSLRVYQDRAAPPGTGEPEADYLCVSVEDTGIGMDEEVRERIFEPFFTTKDVGEGTGLGLAVAYGIVRDHGGWIDVVSAPGQGSRFSIYLPPEQAA
jgi:two-component system, NtrC family, sensor kinase